MSIPPSSSLPRNIWGFTWDAAARAALRITVIYAVVAAIWIFGSDHLVDWYQGLPFRGTTMISWHTAKGWAFVLVTATMLQVLIQRKLRLIKHAEDLRRESELRYRLIVESNMLGVFSWSMDGQISEANDAFLKMVGYSAEDLRAGRIRWNELTPVEYRVRDELAIKQIMDQGVCIPFEKEYHRRDGSRVPVVIGGANFPHRPDQGVSFVLDITEQKKAQASAEAANAAKDRFMAALSHELRTPLTPVLAVLNAWQKDSQLPAAYAPDLQLMRRNLDNEIRLIDDLLDLTRIVQGKLTLNLRPVDVGVLLRETLEASQHDIAAKNLQFTADIAPDGLWALGDAARLRQVWWNLMKNAIKFTPTNGSISLRAQRGEKEISITLADSGIGLDDEILQGVFHPFHQHGNKMVSNQSSLGIGLVLVRGIVESHGGKLQIVSGGPQCGAQFTISLPLVESANIRDVARCVAPGQIPLASPASRIPAPVASSARKGLNILLVEDHADTARTLTRLLKVRGHSITWAEGVQAALVRASQQTFDMLISDIGLPDGSGVDLMVQLQRIRPTPGIAISGFGLPEDIQKSREAGFIEHLVKPLNLDQLEALLASSVKG